MKKRTKPELCGKDVDKFWRCVLKRGHAGKCRRRHRGAPRRKMPDRPAA